MQGQRSACLVSDRAPFVLLDRTGPTETPNDDVANTPGDRLGPTINLHRSPLGGRGFECISEDPVLSGELAASIINGLQSSGVAACPKVGFYNTSSHRH